MWTGPLTSPFSLEGNAWSRSEEGDPDWPDLQYLFISGGPAMDYGLFITDLIGFRRDDMGNKKNGLEFIVSVLALTCG
ncbi:hypothetical protein E2C01_069271 [Portunus trituberculatus]|uniref:Uncharacterized protein n=1 Tax=Portunus trituberculatus TaxID=210409 RepID=A0A5B7HPL9_PORTR|nr:hypothetical protein [Portunus trituberculatus]